MRQAFNVLRFVTRRDEFMIIPDSMGSNCDVGYKTVDAMMKTTLKVKAVESPDYSTLNIHYRD